MEIIYLKHNQIDKQKWDAAIENSENGLVYALSWYLDIVSPNWEALIVGDYEIVMPLTIRKKFGLRYFFKPVFVHFLGVFSKKKIYFDIVEAFVVKTLQYVSFIDNWFNPENNFRVSQNFIEKKSQILDLNSDYNTIHSNYSRSNKNNFKKVRNAGLSIEKNFNKDILITLLKGMYSRKNVDGVAEKDFENLGKIMDYALVNNLGEYYTIVSEGIPCSAGFYLKWKNRSIIYHAANELGRKKRSMFLLVDEYIKDHAGQNLSLDFAGSNIPGVAGWNTGFGAQNLKFYAIRINKLPIPLRWIKK
ncbi:MAG: hypothetical protein JEY96_00540 [Bacteroidales bacterium]|nr:hypothetical protein [Bacteroidales bacterium]